MPKTIGTPAAIPAIMFKTMTQATHGQNSRRGSRPDHWVSRVS
ncbi:hypothetical protein [Sphingomonas sp. 2R-10]|nr:hypothetical protein [Sphingomonas sp. 2R-10]